VGECGELSLWGLSICGGGLVGLGGGGGLDGGVVERGGSTPGSFWLGVGLRQGEAEGCCRWCLLFPFLLFGVFCGV